jgi:hypothetical protein
MLALFGWMDLLIIGKWMTEKNVEKCWDPVGDKAEFDAIGLSPSIITTMIDMFLNMGSN